MIRRSQSELIQELRKEGFQFNEFALMQEGNYSVDDVDWNYKDIPHFAHVHQQAEAYPTFITDDCISSILAQPVLGFRVPMALMNYQSGPRRQTYYTSAFFFVLVIETTCESIGPAQTRVRTNYAIGAKGLMRIFFPLLRWSIKRNYRMLMAGDVPMRERRGEIRKWGYSFRLDGQSQGFEGTLQIGRSNVIRPQALAAAPESTIDLRAVLPTDGTYLWGRSDHLGLRLVREGTTVVALPRLCPHEGACLDLSPCVGGQTHCPWHGRKFKPLATFALDGADVQRVVSADYDFLLTGGVLRLTAKAIAQPAEAV